MVNLFSKSGCAALLAIGLLTGCGAAKPIPADKLGIFVANEKGTTEGVMIDGSIGAKISEADLRTLLQSKYCDLNKLQLTKLEISAPSPSGHRKFDALCAPSS